MINKLTEEILINLIDHEEYCVIGSKTTICCLVLKNGFEVIGSSACVDVNNFDIEIGQKIAYTVAFEKLWELEGYKLQYDRLRGEK